MVLTPLLHAAITLAAQAVVGLLTGDWLAGGVLACFWWFGREHAQAEYRWISAVGTGKRAAMPWWGGFDPRAWNFPSVLDWLLPMVAVAGAWALRHDIAALPWQQICGRQSHNTKSAREHQVMGGARKSCEHIPAAQKAAVELCFQERLISAVARVATCARAGA